MKLIFEVMMLYNMGKRNTITFLALFSFALVLKSQDVSVDKKLGEEGFKSVETSMGFYADTVKGKILTDLGVKLSDNLNNKLFDYKFYIVDMGEPNAFALPGGYIFFTRGILALANTEDELAGVMGHEIIHSNNRHSIKQFKTGVLAGILSLPQALVGILLGEDMGKLFSPITKGGEAIGASHSRKDENEADKQGVLLSANSGYNPASLAVILNNLNQTIEVFTGKKEEPSYFRSHPLTADRIKNINKESGKLQIADKPKLFKSNDEFLRFVDGMMVGPNPKQGVFQGGGFIHPELNFKFDIPQGWIKENTTSAVACADTTNSAVVMLEIDSKHKSIDTAAMEYAAEVKKKTGNEVAVLSKNVSGFNSKSLTFDGKDKEKAFKISVYWIDYDSLIYKLTGVANPEFEEMVLSTIESFRKPTALEIDAITFKKIKVVECVEGETIATLSERTHNVISAELTAAINNVAVDKAFESGKLIKIVNEVPYK